jgi:uncharacterized DUF497 family protein
MQAMAMARMRPSDSVHAHASVLPMARIEFLITGFAGGQLVTVVYTEREGNIRLISVRRRIEARTR